MGQRIGHFWKSILSRVPATRYSWNAVRSQWFCSGISNPPNVYRSKLLSNSRHQNGRVHTACDGTGFIYAVCICIWLLEVINCTLPVVIFLILAGRSCQRLVSDTTNGATLQRRLHPQWKKFQSKSIWDTPLGVSWTRLPVILPESLQLELCIHLCINIQ